MHLLKIEIFYVWMSNWKKSKNENVMYKIMRLFMYVYSRESVYICL